MIDDIPFTARCIRCGNDWITKPARLTLEAEMACDQCGYSATLADFADVATLEAMLKDMCTAARLVH